jgi:hypothetical protein
VLDLADWSVYDLGDLDINTYDATPVEEDEEEDAEPAEPDTATAVDGDAASAGSDTATAA